MSHKGLRGPNSFWKSHKDVKIGVYAICADEPEEFIDRWLDSMNGADQIYVLITKKNNHNTTYFQQKAQEERFAGKLIVKEKEIKPWRFDVARNESLKMVDPTKVDALICTDIDEVLIPEFWNEYKKAVFEHPDFERIYYKYAWSVDEDLNPITVFWYDKTHQPTTHRWQYPVHESLTPKKGTKFAGTYSLPEDKIYLYHLPDQSKSRGSYLDLLELRVQECPEDLYGLFYLSREYSFVQNWKKAIAVGTQLYCSLTKENDDQLMFPALCAHLGRCYTQLDLQEDAEYWLKKGITSDTTFRDNYICLAQLYAHSNRPMQALQLMDEALQKTVHHTDWRTIEAYWRTWKIYQIIGDAYCWLQEYEHAATFFQMAIEDIKTKADENTAAQEGFYADVAFLQAKLNLTATL